MEIKKVDVYGVTVSCYKFDKLEFAECDAEKVLGLIYRKCFNYDSRDVVKVVKGE